MKEVTIRLSGDTVDEIIRSELTEHLRGIEDSIYTHPEDIEYYDALIPALRLVIRHYGG